jgi:hypothetical protein
MANCKLCGVELNPIERLAFKDVCNECLKWNMKNNREPYLGLKRR